MKSQLQPERGLPQARDNSVYPSGYLSTLSWLCLWSLTSQSAVISSTTITPESNDGPCKPYV